MTNWLPSRLTSSERAMAFAFARAYRSVSSLDLNDAPSAGKLKLEGDQYSMCPAGRTPLACLLVS